MEGTPIVARSIGRTTAVGKAFERGASVSHFDFSVATPGRSV